MLKDNWILSTNTVGIKSIDEYDKDYDDEQVFNEERFFRVYYKQEGGSIKYIISPSIVKNGIACLTYFIRNNHIWHIGKSRVPKEQRLCRTKSELSANMFSFVNYKHRIYPTWSRYFCTDCRFPIILHKEYISEIQQTKIMNMIFPWIDENFNMMDIAKEMNVFENMFNYHGTKTSGRVILHIKAKQVEAVWNKAISLYYNI